jgi:hypothetical protein
MTILSRVFRCFQASPSLSVREERLIGAYLDGELAEQMKPRVEKALERQGSALSAELKFIKEVRTEIRSWLALEMSDSDGSRREVDLWPRIERQIKDEERLVRAGLRKKWRESLSEMFDALIWDLRSMLQPRILVGFASLLVFAFYAGALWARDGGKIVSVAYVERDQLSDARGNFGEKEVPVSAAGRMMPQDVINVGYQSAKDGSRRASLPMRSYRGDVMKLAVSQRGGGLYQAQGSKRGENHGVDVREAVDLSASQLIGRGPVPGGLRTHGLDIDWIEADKPVNIKGGASDGSVPPVIWISK